MAEELPLVSIVTPSFNQGPFIEETILSVKNQTYPNIEHIVTDGGSTDNTLDILRKYEGIYNLHWVSEPDEGQSDAINKGWRRAKGEILGWLNSDDTYMPWAAEIAVESFSQYPDVSMVYGDAAIIDESGEVTRPQPGTEFSLKKLLCEGNIVPQQTAFFRKEVLDKVGYLDTKLFVEMDYDYWIRIALKLKAKYVPKLLASFRVCEGTKTVSLTYKAAPDFLYMFEKILSSPDLPEEAKALKRRAYSHAYYQAGLCYYAHRWMKESRRHLVKSAILYPPGFLRPMPLGYLVTALLGKRATELAVKIKSKLTGRH
ncbi:glycosyltransferase family 2 protein [Chloroflexota bacterium]